MPESLEYQSSTLSVPLMYLWILLTAIKCNSLGSDWSLAQRSTTNIISGLEAVKKSNELIKPRYDTH